jgi:hypothetical protein
MFYDIFCRNDIFAESYIWRGLQQWLSQDVIFSEYKVLTKNRVRQAPFNHVPLISMMDLHYLVDGSHITFYKYNMHVKGWVNSYEGWIQCSPTVPHSHSLLQKKKVIFLKNLFKLLLVVIIFWYKYVYMDAWLMAKVFSFFASHKLKVSYRLHIFICRFRP